MDTARLVTIPFSHFCEKARWALDRARIPYREEPHPPLFSYRGTFGAGGRRTAPVLVADGKTYDDSTDILRYADAHGSAPSPLFPAGDDAVAALEDEMDRRLGPATRRLAYSYVLEDRAATRAVLARTTPGWEGRLAAVLAPLVGAGIRRGLRIDAAGVARSRAVIDEVFAHVEATLADGRRFLGGDAFSAADLAFASLAGPIVLPDPYARMFPPFDTLPPAFRAAVDGYRARTAGQFALRVYDAER
jgi:glutathione S-transferase